MALNVAVPVWYDGNGQFLNGSLRAVRTDAIVVGMVSQPNGYTIPGFAPPDLKDTLFIKDKILGALYLDMTRAEWDAAVAGTADGVGLSVIDWIGGDQIPTGNTITSPLLSNIVIFSINKGGVTIYQYIYVDGSPDGFLDISADGGLSDEENIQILYKLA